MLQRIQSIWLLLAAVTSFLSLTLPFYNEAIIATAPDGSNSGGAAVLEYTGASNIPVLLITIITGLISFVTIFLYKNRKLQQKLTIVGMLLSIVIIALYFMQLNKTPNASISLFCIVSILTPAFLFLASRGIYNDSKLVKSADRLRP